MGKRAGNGGSPYSLGARIILILFCGTKGLKMGSYVEFSIDFKNAVFTKIYWVVFSQSSIKDINFFQK